MSRTADEILEAGIRELNSHGYSGKERHAGEGSKDARIRRATGGPVERAWGGDLLKKAGQYAKNAASDVVKKTRSAMDKSAKKFGAKPLNSASLSVKKMGTENMGGKAMDGSAGEDRGAFAKGGKMKKIDDVSHCVRKAKGGAAKARHGYDM